MPNNGKKLIVAGGRNYVLSEEDYAFLDTLDISMLVTGCCRGADTCGREWANRNKIPCKPFPANWDEHGKAAGPIRNRKMAEYADAVVLFPGGRGTNSMAKEAEKAGLEIFDKRNNQNG